MRYLPQTPASLCPLRVRHYSSSHPVAIMTTIGATYRFQRFYNSGTGVTPELDRTLWSGSQGLILVALPIRMPM